VVDVYDALRSRRCYKPGFTVERSEAILTESAGSHLDPTLVEVFLSLRAEVAAIEEKFSEEDFETELAAVWA
jgi:putative two-component system response regulator